MVYRPPIDLMDEPLGALDKKLREQLQLEIRRLHRDQGITVLVYLVPPSFFVIPMSFSEAAFIMWPPVGFTLHNYEMFLSDPLYVGAMIRTIRGRVLHS